MAIYCTCVPNEEDHVSLNGYDFISQEQPRTDPPQESAPNGSADSLVIAMAIAFGTAVGVFLIAVVFYKLRSPAHLRMYPHCTDFMTQVKKFPRYTVVSAVVNETSSQCAVVLFSQIF